MEKIKITLGEEKNIGDILLNNMISSGMAISMMVSLVSGIIHSCDSGVDLDPEDKELLLSIGYETLLIHTSEDYKAMQVLEEYLDEELPGLMGVKDDTSCVFCGQDNEVYDFTGQGVCRQCIQEIRAL